MTGERSLLRLRISAHDAHYGGGLVDGARMLALFGDVATELCILRDGDEGLFRAYDSVEFLAPVYAGDFIEAEGEITGEGGTSRRMRFTARKVIVPVKGHDSHCDVLGAPIIVCRASGTCVVPKDKQRGPQRRPPWDLDAILWCADPAETARDLQTVLDASVVQPLSKGTAVVRVGRALYGLHEDKGLEERFPGSAPGRARGVGVELVIAVPDVHAVARLAEPANLLHKAPHDAGGGQLECSLKLRDGYVLVVRSGTPSRS